MICLYILSGVSWLSCLYFVSVEYSLDRIFVSNIYATNTNKHINTYTKSLANDCPPDISQSACESKSCVFCFNGFSVVRRLFFVFLVSLMCTIGNEDGDGYIWRVYKFTINEWMNEQVQLTFKICYWDIGKIKVNIIIQMEKYLCCNAQSWFLQFP